MNRLKFVSMLLIFLLIFISFNNVKVYASESSNITYQTHIQDIGWQNTKEEGEIAGTTGRALQLEAIKINKVNNNFTIKYSVHIQDIGWQDWKKEGETAGTTGRALQLEAIKIKLENTSDYSIEYRVHIQDIGWQDWKKDGEIAGTTGRALRLEAIQIRIVRNKVGVRYTSHVEDIGWQAGWKQDGLTSGTTGKNLRDEAIKIELVNAPQNSKIRYDSYVQNIGWQGWKSNGEIAGTTGKALRLEAIKIELVNLEDYKVVYRAHIQDIGWTSWKEDGQVVGNINSGLKIEAIEIKLQERNSNNNNNNQSEEKNILNGIDVSHHQGTIDWKKVKNSNVDFAMIRAGFRGYGSSGSLNKDTQFDYNARNAINNGIDIGIYFFSQATNVVEAREEANFTLELIKNYKITYPVVIDVEYATEAHTGRADNISPTVRTQIVMEFCKIIQQAGYTPMFYADKWFATSNLDMAQLQNNYDYWLAHYTGAMQSNPLLKPSDCTYKYTMWQYTSSGVIDGISGNVDLNIAYKKY